MRKLLLLTITVGVILTITRISSAQTAQGLEKAEAIAHELKLTPQQEAKIIPILKEEAPKIEAIKSDTSLSKLQKAKELRAIHSQTAPEMQQILSPAQYQELQTIRERQLKAVIGEKLNG